MAAWYGALGQARAGRTYRDILAHYFVGTEVRSGSGASPLPSAARPSPSSPETSMDFQPSRPPGKIVTLLGCSLTLNIWIKPKI